MNILDEILASKPAEVEEVSEYLRANLDPGEPFLAYPDLGIFHYFADRPQVSRFSIAVTAAANETFAREILAELPTQRSASGLVLLLADDAFELRYRAAAAVLRIVQRNPHVVLDRAEVLAAALREATRCNRRWQRRAWVARVHARSDPMETADARYVSQGLGYVLTLLLAILDREPLRHAIRALSGDAAQRGTGLEYLDNVLPTELKTALWPLLEDRALAVKATSSEPGVLAELTAGASQGGDLATLRERIFAARRKRAAE